MEEPMVGLEMRELRREKLSLSVSCSYKRNFLGRIKMVGWVGIWVVKKAGEKTFLDHSAAPGCNI
jgi:hypothetical protein